jgi:hypothetical protein
MIMKLRNQPYALKWEREEEKKYKVNTFRHTCTSGEPIVAMRATDLWSKQGILISFAALQFPGQDYRGQHVLFPVLSK